MIEQQSHTDPNKAPSTVEEYNARYGDELEALGIYESDVPKIGPSPADVRVYSQMLAELKDGAVRHPNVPNAAYHDPRVTAEETVRRLGTGRLGMFTGYGGALNDPASAYKIAQQRYAARLLGFQVGDVEVSGFSSSGASGIASMDATFPDKSTLPPLPTYDSQGVYHDSEGKVLNQINVDTHYAAHYLAANKERYNKPEALYNFFKRVTKEAEDEEHGNTIRIPADQATDRGRLSLIRQATRILGYQTDGVFRKDTDGTVTLSVSGVRPGFEMKHSNMRSEIAQKRRQLGRQAVGS